MFQIKYEILDDEKKRISGIKNISEFENDFNTVVGQIQLMFNDRVEGFVDKEIPYDGELLITWFQLLNDAILYLKNYRFATIYKPDTDNIWLEFVLKDSSIEVTQIRAEEQKHVENLIENTPRKVSEVLWHESIRKDEFYSTILAETESLIKRILSVNELMSRSHELMKLEKKYLVSQEIQL